MKRYVIHLEYSKRNICPSGYLTVNGEIDDQENAGIWTLSEAAEMVATILEEGLETIKIIPVESLLTE